MADESSKGEAQGIRVTPAESIAVRCARPKDFRSMAKFVRDEGAAFCDLYLDGLYRKAKGKPCEAEVKGMCRQAYELIDDLQIFLLSVDGALRDEVRDEYEASTQYRAMVSPGEDGENGPDTEEVIGRIRRALKEEFQDSDVKVVFASDMMAFSKDEE